MKLPLKERVLLSGVAIALAAVLISLAVLQYRWAREVSDAANTRLQANLQSSMLGWHDDLYRELAGVFSALQASGADPLQNKARQYSQQFQSWSQTASHPNLVRGLYLFEHAGTEQAQLVQLNTAKGQFENVAWPDEFANVKRLIDDRSTEFVTMTREGGHMHSHRPPPGFDHHSSAGTVPNRRPFGPEGGFSWIDLSQMVLARPQIYHETTAAHVAEPRIGWIVVALDRKVLQEHVLPELAERYFSGSEAHDYEVAVVSDPGATVIFSSDPGFGGEDKSNLDRTMPVFGPPRGMPSQRRDMMPPFGPPPRNQGERHRDRNDAGFSGGFIRLAALQSHGTDNDWRLLLRHRQGSLEAVVAGMRHRNLALSFGVLVVLAGGIAIILISSQRARMLARLQMDFVAAVSHELRTPLAVISSAAENIADGVVAGKQQLTQYGTEIKNQAKHLIQLVEQILLFSATRNKAHHYSLRPVRVTDVIEAALKDTAAMIEDAHVTVEQEIAPNLPPIMGDLPALSHCLQNLITNAVKYGGEARWMRIRANVNDKHGHFEEVQISVEDKGLGIGSSEQNRIFEPFYRSRNVTGQIRGTGLGLSLARDIAEAMGGRLTVSSEPGKGSCFTLYLQFADVSVLQTSSQTAAAVNPNLSKT
ncbi:MAG TPA: HAMP domain-containing sensor histidine kinase [Candidatus Angelobacter sp.]|nr:HAMP domain-containing sensor histidine kinase [Candidatus Angelobacter sp.]